MEHAASKDTHVVIVAANSSDHPVRVHQLVHDDPVTLNLAIKKIRLSNKQPYFMTKALIDYFSGY